MLVYCNGLYLSGLLHSVKIPLTLKKQYYVCHIHLKRPPENICNASLWIFKLLWDWSLLRVHDMTQKPILSEVLPHRLAPVGGQVRNLSLHCECSIAISWMKEELDKLWHKSSSYSPSTGFWIFENPLLHHWSSSTNRTMITIYLLWVLQKMHASSRQHFTWPFIWITQKSGFLAWGQS